MALKTITEDYVWSAIKRAELASVANDSYVMTTPDFPGMVASGSNTLECIEDLYRRLERWVRLSLERGYQLPALPSKDGVIDLNLPANRTLAAYHVESKAPERGDESTYIGGPEELETYFTELDRNP